MAGSISRFRMRPTLRKGVVALQDLAGPLPDILPDGFVLASSYRYGDPNPEVLSQTVTLTNLSRTR